MRNQISTKTNSTIGYLILHLILKIIKNSTQISFGKMKTNTSIGDSTPSNNEQTVVKKYSWKFIPLLFAIWLSF